MHRATALTRLLIDLAVMAGVLVPRPAAAQQSDSWGRRTDSQGWPDLLRAYLPARGRAM